MLHWLRKHKTLLAAPVLLILLMASFSVIAQHCISKATNSSQTAAPVSESSATVGTASTKNNVSCCSNVESDDKADHLCCDVQSVSIDLTPSVFRASEKTEIQVALVPVTVTEPVTPNPRQSPTITHPVYLLSHKKTTSRNLILRI